MALTREQKKKILENLKEEINRQKAMVFVDFTGVKTKEFSLLRKKLKPLDNKLKVVKKTLAKLVFGKEGLEIDTKKLQGEIAVIFGFQDELSPAKIVYEFSRKNKNLKILGGYFEKKFKSAEEMIVLAQLPSKEELLARLVGSIEAPAANFVYVLEGNIKGLIQILTQIKI